MFLLSNYPLPDNYANCTNFSKCQIELHTGTSENSTLLQYFTLFMVCQEQLSWNDNYWSILTKILNGLVCNNSLER